MENSIKIHILSEPLVISMADLCSFRVGLKATNEGDEATDPKLYDTVLFVEGERNYAWDLAVQNGPRGEAWWNLKPSETVEARWPLGEALFTGPGEYGVVLRLGAQESKIQIRVKP